MEKTARAELIRQRFRAFRPSNAIPLPKAKKKPLPERKAAFGGIMAGWFGVAAAWDWGKTDWVQDENAKPSDELKERNRRDISPLTKIAEKLPAKLPRVPLPQ